MSDATNLSQRESTRKPGIQSPRLPCVVSALQESITGIIVLTPRTGATGLAQPRQFQGFSGIRAWQSLRSEKLKPPRVGNSRPKPLAPLGRKTRCRFPPSNRFRANPGPGDAAPVGKRQYGTGETGSETQDSDRPLNNGRRHPEREILLADSDRRDRPREAGIRCRRHVRSGRFRTARSLRQVDAVSNAGSPGRSVRR